MSVAAATPIGSLLTTCKGACDDLTVFIEAVYTQLGKDPGSAVRKEDKSFFSLAVPFAGLERKLLLVLLSRLASPADGCPASTESGGTAHHRTVWCRRC